MRRGGVSFQPLCQRCHAEIVSLCMTTGISEHHESDPVQIVTKNSGLSKTWYLLFLFGGGDRDAPSPERRHGRSILHFANDQHVLYRGGAFPG